MTFGQCPTRVNPWAVGPSQQAVSQLSTAHSAPTSSRVASSSISPAACRSRHSVSPSESTPIPHSQTLGKPVGQAPAADKRNAATVLPHGHRPARGCSKRTAATVRLPPSVRTLQRASGSRGGGQHPASRPPGAELERRAHTSTRRGVLTVVGNTQSPKSWSGTVPLIESVCPTLSHLLQWRRPCGQPRMLC